MTNTIPNVPRELKPCPFCGGTPELPNGDGTQYEIECGACGQAKAGVQICDLMTLEERAADTFTDYRYGEEFVERAKVEAIERWNTRAPSPAGVDADHVEDVRAMVAAPSPAGVDGLEVVLGEDTSFGRKYVALSDAQAIIDGLRGEVDELRRRANSHAERMIKMADKEDQQAQRIGVLVGLLRHAQKQVPTGSGLHMRIDAALSAVCAAAPNIAPTSEHSSQPERDPCPMCIKGGICNTPTCGRLLAMPKAY